MFNLAYESVIGRHGLVQNGSLLWKIGVKNVYNYEEKLVGGFPQLPHNQWGRTKRVDVLPTQSNFYPVFSDSSSTDLSTLKTRQSTDTRRRFSPLSTQPITTTTTYIDREGSTE